MIKKVLLFMVALLCCATVFAGETFKDAQLANGTAKVQQKVVWTYSSEDLYKIGFSETEVSSSSPNPTDVSGNEVVLDSPDMSEEFAAGKGEVYVYWIIESYKDLTISLKNDGHMELSDNAADDTERLNWQASWTKKNPTGSVQGSMVSGTTDREILGDESIVYAKQDVYSQSGRSETEVKRVVGSTKVDIETANAYAPDDTANKEGAYYGTLTLEIATNN